VLGKRCSRGERLAPRDINLRLRVEKSNEATFPRRVRSLIDALFTSPLSVKAITKTSVCSGLYRRTSGSERRNLQEGRDWMADDRLPDHSRLIYVVIGIVLLIVAIPLIVLMVLDVLARDVMH
jgi:hypothetical protein